MPVSNFKKRMSVSCVGVVYLLHAAHVTWRTVHVMRILPRAQADVYAVTRAQASRCSPSNTPQYDSTAMCKICPNPCTHCALPFPQHRPLSPQAAQNVLPSHVSVLKDMLVYPVLRVLVCGGQVSYQATRFMWGV